MNMEVTFLTEQQIWGDAKGKGQLQVMKSYGTKTGMSDLAIVLGGFMGNDTTSDDQRAGFVWSASSDGDGYVRTVSLGGGRGSDEPSGRDGGARPALPSSVTSKIQPSEARLKRKITRLFGKNIEVMVYGEYPQSIAKDDVAQELNALTAAQLKSKETGKKYTFDGEPYDAYDKPFKAKEYAEYQHNGKRYIRVEDKHRDNDSVLSNGRVPQVSEACWIEVEPIEWLKDPSGVWVARQALFAGVQFDRNQHYDGNFGNTDMKRYLDNYFAKEMQVGPNVAASAAVGPATAALADRKARQRQQALDDPSQGL